MKSISILVFSLFILNYFSLVFTKVGFKVKITTWNVCEKGPISNIKDLIQLNENPEFYSFTLQEVNPKANPFSNNDARWVHDINAVMIWNRYALIDWKSIDGSLTVVYSKSEIKSEISNIDTSSKRTGKAGVFGDKGGTAVRFDYRGNSIVFVGSHFQAHDHQLQARIEDFHNINNSIRFNRGKARTIADHDVVFWSGDMNFRIDDLTAEQINETAAAKSDKTAFVEFMSKDQLRKTMKEGKIFKGYVEGNPEFKPTYKYIIGENRYNLERKPAYTDRILYRLKIGNGRFINYTANTDFKISDHKPVTAFIAIN